MEIGITYKILIILAVFAITTAILAKDLFTKRKENAVLPSFERMSGSFSFKKLYISYFLKIAALIAVSAALITGDKPVDESTGSEGISLAVSIDISKSMDAQDIKPSRLEYSKALAGEVLKSKYISKSSLIAFAGEALLMVPLTSDLSVFANEFENLTTSSMSDKSTMFQKSASISIRSLRNVKSEKVLIVFSDGELNINEAKKAVNVFKKNNIHVVFCIAGSEKGAKIPATDGFVKDESGAVVISKPDYAFYQKLSDNDYVYLLKCKNIKNDIKDLDLILNKIEKNTKHNSSYSIFNIRQILILAAFLFICSDVLLSRRNKIEKN